ncbi:MAG: PAS domain-containing sensor histidine kinase [Pseudomonadota bacterium]
MPIDNQHFRSDQMARYQDLLRASVDWIWEIDAELKLTFVSSSITAAVGLPPSAFLGKPLLETLEPAAPIPGAAPPTTPPSAHDQSLELADILTQHQPFRDRSVAVRGVSGADQARLADMAWRLSGVPHYSPETGAFAGYRGTCVRDRRLPEQLGETNRLLLNLLEAALTRKDELERERQSLLHEEEKLAAEPEERLRAVAHELRTPLNAILGFSEIIRDWQFGDMKARYQEYGGLIHDSGQHLLDLVNSLLELAGAEAAEDQESHSFDPLEVARFVLGLLNGQATRKGISLSGELPDALPRLAGTRRALRQILLNLLANAVRHCGPGDTIEMIVQDNGDGEVLFKVRDTGPGIALDQQERIFQRNYQVPGRAAPGGKGLGLAIAQDLALSLGGHLSVRSEPDQGATFTLSLPHPGSSHEGNEPRPGSFAEKEVEAIAVPASNVRSLAKKRSGRAKAGQPRGKGEDGR